jgi:mRNA-degrading endonuclease toxin of MazEF toxin-antitoxin module
MIDKATTVRRAKIGQRIGRVDPGTLRQVNTALAQFLDLS